jgi:hypothetical protein
MLLGLPKMPDMLPMHFALSYVLTKPAGSQKHQLREL